jgi:small subunit ribosomal protein S1
LLEESFSDGHSAEGQVVRGVITAIEKDMAIIDVGLKVEGRVPLKEFGAKPPRTAPSEGRRHVEVYVERIENALGEAVLSREKARREESWVKLEEKFNKGERVEGVIFNQVKGGFTVDLDGAVAFLPRSQVDIRPIRDVTPLMHNPQPFEILKMDRRRGNIVVSRRTVLEESRAEQRSEIVQNLEEGQVVEGVVKNITDYGAFVDLGGIDGLLHVTDMAWRRVNHPTEILNIGQTVKVQIIRINQETHRISLGMKQLEAIRGATSAPSSRSARRSPARSPTSPTTARSSSWSRASKASSTSRKCPGPRRTSIPARSCRPRRKSTWWCSRSIRPSAASRSASSRRSRIRGRPSPQPSGRLQVEGEVKNKTEFGLFIGLDGDVDGMVHLSDLDWNRPGEQVIEEYNRGEMVKAQVLDVDVEKERISLGIKQLGVTPSARARTASLRKNAVVTCEVTEVKDGGIEVRLVDQRIDGLHQARRPVARPRRAAPRALLAVGQKVDARVIAYDKKTRKIRSRSRRWKSPRRRKPSRSTARPTPAPRSATSWAPR